jgi:hypothetical protein
MKPSRSFLILTFLIGLITLTAIDATAQEKHHIAYQVPAENTKYIQQHAIDAGDVKGHQVRILEVKRLFPKDTLVFEGVNVVEESDRGYSDYIDGNGRNWGYSTFVLETGDKVFARWDGNAQTVHNSDGTKKSTGISTSIFSGGTGKYLKIKGTLRGSYTFDAGKGINMGQWEGDYWMED